MSEVESVKLTRLTALNVQALRETLTPEEAERVTVTATTAEFAMSAGEALRMMVAVKDRVAAEHGRRGHPAQSLSAVIGKLRLAG